MSNIIPFQRNLPPEKLDFDGALKLMFIDFEPNESAKPKRSWTAGRRPEFEENNDHIERLKQLDDIIKSASDARDRDDNKAITLLPKHDLSLRGIACPYFYARLGVAYAVNQATVAEKDYINAKIHRSKEQEKLYFLAKEALEKLNQIQEEYTPFDIFALTKTTGRFGHHIDPYLFHNENENTKNSYIDIAKASNGLSSIMNSISNERSKYIKGGDLEIWVASYITGIGHLWTDLVGEPPTARGEFGKFLSASYRAIGGTRKISGVRRIETSTQSRPNQSVSDKNFSVVPPRYLLLCEIQSCKSIDPNHAEDIRRAVEFEDENPEITIQKLRETGKLSVAVQALLDLLPWSPEAQAAAALGIPLDAAKVMLADIEFN